MYTTSVIMEADLFNIENETFNEECPCCKSKTEWRKCSDSVIQCQSCGAVIGIETNKVIIKGEKE